MDLVKCAILERYSTDTMIVPIVGCVIAGCLSYVPMTETVTILGVPITVPSEYEPPKPSPPHPNPLSAKRSKKLERILDDDTLTQNQRTMRLIQQMNKP